MHEIDLDALVRQELEHRIESRDSLQVYERRVSKACCSKFLRHLRAALGREQLLVIVRPEDRAVRQAGYQVT